MRPCWGTLPFSHGAPETGRVIRAHPWTQSVQTLICLIQGLNELLWKLICKGDEVSPTLGCFSVTLGEISSKYGAKWSISLSSVKWQLAHSEREIALMDPTLGPMAAARQQPLPLISPVVCVGVYHICWLFSMWLWLISDPHRRLVHRPEDSSGGVWGYLWVTTPLLLQLFQSAISGPGPLMLLENPVTISMLYVSEESGFAQDKMLIISRLIWLTHKWVAKWICQLVYQEKLLKAMLLPFPCFFSVGFHTLGWFRFQSTLPIAEGCGSWPVWDKL